MSGAFSVVGERLPRVDAMDQTMGKTQYVDDMTLPGMLVGRHLTSIHAHARILSIDTSRAEALVGVHAVITGADLPITYGILPISQDEHALAVGRVRYVGEPVAAVAAINPEIAEQALALIDVSYEPLDEVVTLEQALETDHPMLHGDGLGQNVHRSAALEFGDVEEGFARADYVREDVFFFGGNTHAALETHVALASYSQTGKLTLWSSTQVPHYVHRTLEKVLELPAGRIRVIATAIGGGFGGKTDPFSHELTAAKLSMVTGRPVKINLSREEVFYAHRGRHPVLMWVKTGFENNGQITSMHFKTFLDGGAYSSYGVASLYYTGALQTTTYRIPNYRFEGLRVFTNKPPCGPKRGHGTPQPRFGLECHLDKAAADLGLDPVTIRQVNAVEPFSTTVNHLRITSCALVECIDKVVEASDFTVKRGRLPSGRGVGLAVGAYMSGAGLPIYFNDMPQSEVQIKIDRGGGVTVYSMATDIGQGSTTMLATVVAEALGLEPRDINMVIADTDLTPVDLGSYSSRVTFMAGNAAVTAGAKIRSRVVQAVADELGVDPAQVVTKGGRVGVSGDLDRCVTWAEAVRLAIAATGPLVESGGYTAPKLAGTFRGAGVGISPAYSYSACVVEVDCAADTGLVKVERVWLAHDIGRALNPLLTEGQVEGGVYMGLGEALYEEHTFRGGLHRGPSLLDYKIPTALDMPPVETFLVESDDPEGPLGAKEVGQGPLLPVIPAVANAIHDALGVRIDEVPITPQKIVAALRNVSRGRPGRIGPETIPDFEFSRLTRVEPPEGFVTP
ncbi:4-hydroxybenzoyl-CoA reductase subunit alpha [bacterium BMS3Bbin02]|nr:4-hydroxybenzoyl-CoA reductase subunit alpha [bacterium BMS3Bbin02]